MVGEIVIYDDGKSRGVIKARSFENLMIIDIEGKLRSIKPEVISGQYTKDSEEFKNWAKDNYEYNEVTDEWLDRSGKRLTESFLFIKYMLS